MTRVQRLSRNRFRTSFLTRAAASALLLMMAAPGRTQKGAGALAPLEARLQVPLDTGKLVKGMPVFAAAVLPWHGPDCELKAGATVYGHVVDLQVRSPGTPETLLTVAFEKADCNGRKAVEVPLLLYAVVDRSSAGQADTYRDQSGLFGAIQPHPPIGTGGPTGPSTTARVRQDMSTSASNGPSSVTAGEVYGVPRVLLAVGTGQDGASVVHSSRKSFRLNAGTDLVLVVTQPHAAGSLMERKAEAAPLAASQPPAVAVVAPPTPPPPPPDETEVCADHCSVVSTQTSAVEAIDASHQVLAVVPLSTLGFRPKVHAEMTAFDEDTTVNYLGDNEILLTFDPHSLRSHTQGGWHTYSVRTVRAVLVDARDGHIERAVDWRVTGEGRYVWPAGPDHVLAHVGDALRLIGPGLRVGDSFPVSGDLRWVAVSPNGQHAGVGILQERHTREVHESIATLSGVDPEEDLEVKLLDFSAHSNRRLLLTSRTAQPVLSDEGELQVRRTARGPWALTETGWTGAKRNVAEWNSGCEPVLSVPTAGAVFIEGCSPEGGQRWFRILRTDGRTLLKGESSSQQIQERAGGSRSGAIAVRVIETTKSLPAGGLFSAAVLGSEWIGVYRAQDGHRLFETREPTFPESSENFALSPEGDRLAVLTATSLKILSVDHNLPRAEK